jgi:A/G-specific adenine glycosylase
VPDQHDALLALPGVGPYSAGAILSIAHGKAAPIVDGNVVRVLCRLFGLRGDPTRAPLKHEIWALATELVPEARPGDFNQSMMELGATVCTPRSPACLTCPLTKRCAARKQGLETALPELPKRRATVDVARAAAVVRRGDHVLSVIVPPAASRWAGMWQFPNADVGSGETAEDAARRAVHDAIGVRVSGGERLLTVRHAVTHHRITLDVFAYAVKTTKAREGLAWKRPDELHELAMPSAHRRIAKALEDAE